MNYRDVINDYHLAPVGDDEPNKADYYLAQDIETLAQQVKAQQAQLDTQRAQLLRLAGLIQEAALNDSLNPQWLHQQIIEIKEILNA